ncbi:hypothetical protein B0H14DRAFT_2897944 [Mycena olivaceomarginata]|nr:hypothetical protein B0H14DRAFT_2897944 [Mycena olivaceomarginata]
MSTVDTVLENSPYHARLLRQIAELEYVPAALQEQETHIAGLKRDSAALTKKERMEHELQRDNSTGRFMAKLTGRKEKRVDEAMEAEMQAKKEQEVVHTMLAEAKAGYGRADLQDKLQVYNQTKQELAALYSKIFDGPTPAYPEDDQLEYHLLQSANTALQACSSKIQQALKYSKWDMIGGGVKSDMMERNALTAAEVHATLAQIFIQQAIMASPQVQAIGGSRSRTGGSFLSDVFDNIFTDLAFHDKIKKSARSVEAGQLNLTNQLNLARARADSIGADLKTAADVLAHAQGALAAFRCGVFDRPFGEVPAEGEGDALPES